MRALFWYALPRHAAVLPHLFPVKSNYTALTARCPLLSAFQAGGTGPGQMASPGNTAGVCAFSPACDDGMLCTHLRIRTLAQRHQHPQVTGRASNS